MDNDTYKLHQEKAKQEAQKEQQAEVEQGPEFKEEPRSPEPEASFFSPADSDNDLAELQTQTTSLTIKDDGSSNIGTSRGEVVIYCTKATQTSVPESTAATAPASTPASAPASASAPIDPNRIPEKWELIKKPFYPHSLPKRPAGDNKEHYKYWVENGSAIYRFIMDNYLSRKQNWMPEYRSRFKFLSNEKKIEKICAHIGCTRQEYIQYFELDNTTRNQSIHSNYAPVWYLALATISEDALDVTWGKQTDFFLRVWLATYDRNPLVDADAHWIVQIHPPAGRYVLGGEKSVIGTTWEEYLDLTWRSMEEYARRDEEEELDSDPDFR